MYFCHQTCSSLSPIEDAVFGRIDDIGDMFKREVHLEFISNCLMKSAAHLFADYSYIYILVAHGPPERRTAPHESCWIDLLSQEQCALMRRNNGFILGYMLMSIESPKDVYLIECIDTRVSGCNIAEAMIHKYENEVAMISSADNNLMSVKTLPKCVLPREITQNAVFYWKKFFEKRYGVQQSQSLLEVKTRTNVDGYVLWDALNSLLLNE